MKKIVALVLSLVMALSLCTVAFAAVKNDDVLYDGLTLNAAKKYTYVDEYEAGKTNFLPYLAGEDGNYYYVATSGTAMYDADLNASGLYLGDMITDGGESIRYDYQAKAQAAQAWSCYQDQLKAGYIYVDENDDTCYAVAEKNGELKLLVDGKIVEAKEYTPVAGQHILYYTGAKMTEVKVGVYQVKCAACGKDVLVSKTNINGAGYLYENDFEDYWAWHKATGMSASFPANGTILQGTWYVLEDTTAATTDAVSSAKTFDAGVAMYVGMSLLSVAGGAVVIGKKKEF